MYHTILQLSDGQCQWSVRGSEGNWAIAGTVSREVRAGSEYVNSFNGQYNIVIWLYAHISNTNGCMNFTLSSRQEHFGYFR